MPVYAQEFVLPKPGVMVHLSPAFNPPVLRGIKVDPNNPFRFDFILDPGDSLPPEGRAREGVNQEQLKIESTRLIKYFLASLTVPEKDLWVNLSPYEKDRIVPESFGQTEMGRDLLAQDYILKQITASLIYPEDEIGKKFWKRIYEEAQKKYGTTQVPVNTFNKVWIVPEKAVVYEHYSLPPVGRVREGGEATAYVVESKLKVMLEQDYLAKEKNISPPLEGGVRGGGDVNDRNDVGSIGVNIVKEIVIPELTKEINEGKNFAQLRQVYNSLILATWYKKKIKDSILAKVYADKGKVAGVGYESFVIARSEATKQSDVEGIYQQYLKAFKKGAYNYIKEEVDPATQQLVPRKYFSGGVDFDKAMNVVLEYTNQRFVPVDNAMLVTADMAMSGQAADQAGENRRLDRPASESNMLLLVEGSNDLYVAADPLFDLLDTKETGSTLAVTIPDATGDDRVSSNQREEAINSKIKFQLRAAVDLGLPGALELFHLFEKGNVVIFRASQSSRDSVYNAAWHERIHLEFFHLSARIKNVVRKRILSSRHPEIQHLKQLYRTLKFSSQEEKADEILVRLLIAPAIVADGFPRNVSAVINAIFPERDIAAALMGVERTSRPSETQIKSIWQNMEKLKPQRDMPSYMLAVSEVILGSSKVQMASGLGGTRKEMNAGNNSAMISISNIVSSDPVMRERGISKLASLLKEEAVGIDRQALIESVDRKKFMKVLILALKHKYVDTRKEALDILAWLGPKAQDAIPFIETINYEDILEGATDTGISIVEGMVLGLHKKVQRALKSIADQDIPDLARDAEGKLAVPPDHGGLTKDEFYVAPSAKLSSVIGQGINRKIDEKAKGFLKVDSQQVLKAHSLLAERSQQESDLIKQALVSQMLSIDYDAFGPTRSYLKRMADNRRNLLEEFLSAQYELLLLLDTTGYLKGFAVLGKKEGEAKLIRLAIDQNDLEEGRGSMLMDALLQAVKEQGIKVLTLDCRKDAVGFYTQYFNKRGISFTSMPKPGSEVLTEFRIDNQLSKSLADSDGDQAMNASKKVFVPTPLPHPLSAERLAAINESGYRYVTHKEFMRGLKDIASKLNKRLQGVNEYVVLLDDEPHKSKRWVYALIAPMLKKKPKKVLFAGPRLKGNLEGINTVVIVDDMLATGHGLVPVMSSLGEAEYRENVIMAVPFYSPEGVKRVSEDVQRKHIIGARINFKMEFVTGDVRNTIPQLVGAIFDHRAHAQLRQYHPREQPYRQFSSYYQQEEIEFKQGFVTSDRAMNIPTGGIDLTSDKVLEVKSNGQVDIKFNFDPAMLAQLENAQGFVPVIINIQPLKDLHLFLGIADNPIEIKV